MTCSVALIWRRRGEMMADVLHASITPEPERQDLRRVRFAIAGRYVALSETTHQDSGRMVAREAAC